MGCVRPLFTYCVCYDSHGQRRFDCEQLAVCPYSVWTLQWRKRMRLLVSKSCSVDWLGSLRKKLCPSDE